MNRLSLLLSLVLAALALAACGGDEGDKPASTSEAKAPACAKDELALVTPAPSP